MRVFLLYNRCAAVLVPFEGDACRGFVADLSQSWGEMLICMLILGEGLWRLCAEAVHGNANTTKLG